MLMSCQGDGFVGRGMVINLKITVVLQGDVRKFFVKQRRDSCLTHKFEFWIFVQILRFQSG